MRRAKTRVFRHPVFTMFIHSKLLMSELLGNKDDPPYEGPPLMTGEIGCIEGRINIITSGPKPTLPGKGRHV